MRKKTFFIVFKFKSAKEIQEYITKKLMVSLRVYREAIEPLIERIQENENLQKLNDQASKQWLVDNYYQRWKIIKPLPAVAKAEIVQLEQLFYSTHNSLVDKKVTEREITKERMFHYSLYMAEMGRIEVNKAEIDSEIEIFHAAATFMHNDKGLDCNAALLKARQKGNKPDDLLQFLEDNKTALQRLKDLQEIEVTSSGSLEETLRLEKFMKRAKKAVAKATVYSVVNPDMLSSDNLKKLNELIENQRNNLHIAQVLKKQDNLIDPDVFEGYTELFVEEVNTIISAAGTNIPAFEVISYLNSKNGEEVVVRIKNSIVSFQNAMVEVEDETERIYLEFQDYKNFNNASESDKLAYKERLLQEIDSNKSRLKELKKQFYEN